MPLVDLSCCAHQRCAPRLTMHRGSTPARGSSQEQSSSMQAHARASTPTRVATPTRASTPTRQGTPTRAGTPTRERIGHGRWALDLGSEAGSAPRDSMRRPPTNFLTPASSMYGGSAARSDRGSRDSVIRRLRDDPSIARPSAMVIPRKIEITSIKPNAGGSSAFRSTGPLATTPSSPPSPGTNRNLKGALFQKSAL